MTAHAVGAQQLSENRLLATLRPELFDAIAPHVQRVPLEVRDRIFDTRRTITHAYFPTEGVASLLAPIEGAPDAWSRSPPSATRAWSACRCSSAPSRRRVMPSARWLARPSHDGGKVP